MVQFGFLSAYDLLDLYMYFKKVMQTDKVESVTKIIIFEWASVGNIYPPGGGKINEVFSHYSLLIRYSVFTIGKRVFNCN